MREVINSSQKHFPGIQRTKIISVAGNNGSSLKRKLNLFLIKRVRLFSNLVYKNEKLVLNVTITFFAYQLDELFGMIGS